MHGGMHQIVQQNTLRAYARTCAFVKQGRAGKAHHRASRAALAASQQHQDQEADASQKAEAGRAVEAMLARVPLPDELRRVYRVVAMPHSDYVFGDQTLMSLDEVCERYGRRAHGPGGHMVDFALAYAGMGHVRVASYDPTADCVHYRMDGGSNALDAAVGARVSDDAPPHPISHWFTIADGA